MQRTVGPRPPAPRVLLAEDDEPTRIVLAEALRSMGLSVVDVADGGRMLVSVATRYREPAEPDVDLIVTDVRMPVCSGLDIVEALRAAKWRTPVIFVTGHATPWVLEMAERLGATVMLKPLDLESFEKKVRDLLTVSRTPRVMQ